MFNLVTFTCASTGRVVYIGFPFPKGRWHMWPDRYLFLVLNWSRWNFLSPSLCHTLVWTPCRLHLLSLLSWCIPPAYKGAWTVSGNSPQPVKGESVACDCCLLEMVTVNSGQPLLTCCSTLPLFLIGSFSSMAFMDQEKGQVCGLAGVGGRMTENAIGVQFAWWQEEGQWQISWMAHLWLSSWLTWRRWSDPGKSRVSWKSKLNLLQLRLVVFLFQYPKL